MRRNVVTVGAVVALLAGSGLISAVSAAGQSSNGQAVIHGRPELTPLRHAKPAAAAPYALTNQASPWVRLRNAPPFPPGSMLLASDGTVLVHAEPASGGTNLWYKLTPDSHGNYANGTWSQIASMPASYDPLYFSSAILPDGRMIVEGGEYLGGTPTWTSKGAIYNPVTNKWRSVQPPAGWTNIGDAMGIVLSNGTYMQQQACQNCTSSNPILSTSFALFNATGLNWISLSGQGKNDPNDEEGWTLQPDGSLLTVDTWLTPTTERFTPSNLSWSIAGNTVRSPVNTPSAEIGPQMMLPNGDTFVVGAGTGPEAPAACTTRSKAATALHTAAGNWVNGPAIPTFNGMQYDSADGPGALLPDGNALFDVSPCVYNAPIVFMLYNAQTRTLSPVPNVPNAANDSTYYTRLLVLPNGQVLFNDGSSDMEVYTGGGTPNPAWAPSINSISTTNLTPGKSATLSGTQLAGLDQGAAYGDDVQDATNFPIVRITNNKTHVVTYARTSNWSSVSVAPGAASSTRFTLPAGTPAGASSLVVIANGIASAPVPVTVS
jgi:hypothetical protein